MALTREQKALFGGYSTESGDIRDAMQKSYRDLEVNIVTRLDRVNISDNVIELRIEESISQPYLTGKLIFADNSALTTTLPIVGQELVEIKFIRAGVEIEHIFSCTNVTNITKALGETAGVEMHLESTKLLTNAVSIFSKSYSGLASDIIQKIHTNFLKEPIDIKTQSSTAHNVVFPFGKPYPAIRKILSTTFGSDGTPYYLFENLVGDGPILKSLGDMLTEEDDLELFELRKRLSFNTDTEMGQGSRSSPKTIGALYSYNVLQQSNTMALLSGGALSSNTIRINPANKDYTENSFYYEDHAAGYSKLDPYQKYEINDTKLSSGILKPSIGVEFHNPIAFESEGVTELNTQSDVLAKTKRSSFDNRINNMIRITAEVDSHPEKMKAGVCVNMIMIANAPPIDGEKLEDKLNSGRHLITSMSHILRSGEYTMELELSREGLSQPAKTGKTAAARSGPQ